MKTSGKASRGLIVILSVINSANGANILNTYAGGNASGSFSGDGGPATSAHFSAPYDVWVDSSGNFFIADYGNKRIRQISGGIVSTVYGSGSATHGGDAGKATSAGGQVLFVTGDTNGNLFFSDKNAYVRKVDLTTGMVDALAGAISGSTDDGVHATSADLGNPRDMAVDTAGNVYIACHGTLDQVRMVAAGTGLITTIAGNGAGELDNGGYFDYALDSTKDGDNGMATSANIVLPNSLFLNSVGQLYIGEEDGKSIRMVDLSTGIITLEVGTGEFGYNSGNGGPALKAKLSNTLYLTGDEDNNLFISATSESYVRYVNTESIIDTFASMRGSGAPSGDGGPATSGHVYSPTGLAAFNGVLYIAEPFGNQIRSVTYSIPSPVSIVGTLSLYAGNPNGSSDLDNPTGVWVDTTGVMFVADHGNNKIRKVDSSGIVTTYFGTGNNVVSGDGGSALAAGGSPYSMCGFTDGTMYFVDTGSVRKINTNTNIVTAFAGMSSSGSTNDNIKATAASMYPISCVVDTSGNVYISSQTYHKVQKVDVGTNLIKTVAGDGQGEISGGHYYDYYAGTTKDGDGGDATSAQLSFPSGLFLDTTNQLFVSQFDGKTVRKVDLTTGIISLVAGTGTMGITGNGGPATEAKFLAFGSFLSGDAKGNLFYSNLQFSHIRLINTNTGMIYGFAGSMTAEYGYAGDGGDATAGLLTAPGACFAYNGVLYVPDGTNPDGVTSNNAIRAIAYDAGSPTELPSAAPGSVKPSPSPSTLPTIVPTVVPTVVPTAVPTTVAPTRLPTALPTTTKPSVSPTDAPTSISAAPSIVPSWVPTIHPTVDPTVAPSVVPNVDGKSHTHHKKKLSAGAIAGIVIGAVVAFLLCLGCCFFLFSRNKKEKKTTITPAPAKSSEMVAVPTKEEAV